MRIICLPTKEILLICQYMCEYKIGPCTLRSTKLHQHLQLRVVSPIMEPDNLTLADRTSVAEMGFEDESL